MADDGDDTDRYYSSQSQKFLEIFDKEFPPVNRTVRRDEIGGLDSVIEQLEKFQHGIEHRVLYEYMGVTPPNGVILHGPPGYGKTYLAEFLSYNLGARFVDLPLTQYESKWVGQAEQTLKSLLDLCQQHYAVTGAKVFVFMDEAEEALKSRKEQGWHGPRVNTLLRYMDGFEKREGVIYGAATNYIERVDPAFLRSGRLDFKIEIKPYDALQMADVVRATMTRINRKADRHDPIELSTQDYHELGKLATTLGLTPADIGEAFRNAGEEKVVRMIKHPGPDFTPDMYHVYKDDIAIQFSSLKKKAKTDRIGFL